MLILLGGCSAPSPDPDAALLRELVPTGSLRVAIAIAPAPSTFFSARDAATGELVGVGVDLGAGLAARLGVPVEFIEYAGSGELTEGAALGAWDVTFMPADEERARLVDFGTAYNLFESSYIVAPGSTIAAIAEVDTPGVRVGGILNTTTARSASRQLSAASVHSYRSVDEVIEALATGAIDAAAMGRASLRSVATAVPGARILDGSFHSTTNAVAVPKNRPVALAYVSGFIEEAITSGEVRSAFERAGIGELLVLP